MRLVVKIGSSLLASNNGVDVEFIQKLANDICELEGNSFIIVTSGAIATGMKKLKLKQKPQDVTMQQALAAIGQSSLMRVYERVFQSRKILAQVLLTNYDFAERKRYLNVQNTLNALISKGVVPIINENDTVTVQDIKKTAFGDNDSLAAQVAVATDADMLIILTNVDGLYDGSPTAPESKIIREVKEINEEIMTYALGGTASSLGRGGMIAKVRAAKIAAEAGVRVVVAPGKTQNPVKKAMNEEIGTLFHAQENALNPKKHWIAFASESKGRVNINRGATEAIIKGGSLLPVGIVSVRGDFEKGDVVDIFENNKVVARGITNYFSKDLETVKGLKEEMIGEKLGYVYTEAVARVNMVVMNGKH